MDDLRNLWIFNKVASLQSFSAAAKELNLTRSRVSQAIKELEVEWQTRLIIRSTRSFALTASGAKLLQSSSAAFDRLAEVEREIREEKEQLSGSLRISCTYDLGQVRIAELVQEFRRANPGVQVELNFEDAVTNLMKEGIDVGIRVGWLKDSALRAVKLAPMLPMLVSRPELVAGMRLREPRDLLSLPWIGMNLLDAPLRWNFRRKGKDYRIKASAAVNCNAPSALYALVKAGAGIGLSPDYQVEADIESGELVQLLPEYRVRDAGIYALHTYERQPPARVRSLIEFLRARF